MTRVLFKVSNVGPRASVIQEKLPFAIIRDNAVVAASPLGADVSLNEHLVWLWGMLQHDRRFLKSTTTDGAVLTCECKAPMGVVHLRPNGAEMLHLLGAELVLSISG